jgi:hypothetical protein
VHAHGGQPSDLRACFDWTPIASLSSPSDNNVFMNRKPHAHTEQADNRATVHHHRALIKRSIIIEDGLIPKSFGLFPFVVRKGRKVSHDAPLRDVCTVRSSCSKRDPRAARIRRGDIRSPCRSSEKQGNLALDSVEVSHCTTTRLQRHRRLPRAKLHPLRMCARRGSVPCTKCTEWTSQWLPKSGAVLCSA